MKSICVFCGASERVEEPYRSIARSAGQEIGSRGYSLVYGASSKGTMNEVASGVIEAGQAVVGVIPEFLTEKESPRDDLTELILVKTMAERINLMCRRSDAILVLPGGIGTLEELLTVFSAALTGIFIKPIGILNVNGFYDGLRELLDRMGNDKFLDHEELSLLHVGIDVNTVLDSLADFEAAHFTPRVR